MTHLPIMPLAAVTLACGLLAACGGGGGAVEAVDRPVAISLAGPNAVSQWNEIAATTANVAAATTGTPEEQRPNVAVDLATVHLAMYDAVMAIVGTHKPYAIKLSLPTAGASQEAAVGAAAYRVLLGLFPNRASSYQAAYDSFLATIADGSAKSMGLAIGEAAAAGILALRANDGRSEVLAAYVPGTAPGQFRGTNPIGRPNPFIKPFALTSVSQFRAPGPPALTSAAYAADVNETMAMGSATSTVRTADQTELARFATENPGLYWTRNLRNFAMTGASLADHARLMAMIWVAQADAGNACFDSKYHYQAWRPSSAITLADTDGNDATTADPGWKPIVTAPNHPEYPAAHSCVTSAMAETLRGFYGTPNITFDLNSTVSGTSRHYTNIAAMVDEVATARIAGGTHFRTSTTDGAALGRNVANWVMAHHFQPE